MIRTHVIFTLVMLLAIDGVGALAPRPARADDRAEALVGTMELPQPGETFYQPELIPRGWGESSVGMQWGDSPARPGLDREWQRSFGTGGGEPWGAEDRSAEDDVPRIPEPMVFDLVRPLGARRGEAEINTLGLVPFRRTVPVATGIPDAPGVIQGTRLARIEWAPEVEWVPRDNFALELELPMVDGIVAAYKGAAQVTFGTAFARRYIHGAQVILEYEVEADVWLPTYTYIGGVRFDDVWSALAMIGLRNEIKSEDKANRTLSILNLSLFADVGPSTTLGLETNYSANMRGDAALLIMPQCHCEVTDRFMIQSGIGALLTQDYTLPQAGFRVILSR